MQKTSMNAFRNNIQHLSQTGRHLERKTTWLNNKHIRLKTKAIDKTAKLELLTAKSAVAMVLVESLK